ncbi:MAG: hypothetical protein IR153_00300 [Flavobacterium sp.]|nr:hypothetical protein [Flavobacterium sp.]
MKIIPRKGVDELLFGMTQKDVEAIYGPADRVYEDEDDNIVALYYDKKLRLTFYEDENFKLGYIITANPKSSLFDSNVIGKQPDEVKRKLEAHNIKSWQQEEFDISVSHYNEQNWLTLESEFGEVVKVELGAMINDKDEFEWAFKAKK